MAWLCGTREKFWYKFGHFFASSLIHANVDLAAISGALGHSDPSITNSIYLHFFQDANARASEAIASVLDFSQKKDDKPKNSSDDTTR